MKKIAPLFIFLAGLGVGLGYALYSIFSRYAIDRCYHSLTITCYTFVIAAIGGLFLSDRVQVAATLIGFFLLQEHIRPMGIVGIVLVLFAMLLCEGKEKQRKERTRDIEKSGKREEISW